MRRGVPSLKMPGAVKGATPTIAKRSCIVQPFRMVGLEVDVGPEIGREISFDIEQILVDEVYPDLPRFPDGEDQEIGSRMRLEFLRRLDEAVFQEARKLGSVHKPITMGRCGGATCVFDVAE